MTYLDLEMTKALTIIQEGLLDIERKLEKITRIDLLDDEEKDAIQGICTGGIIVLSHNEVLALVRMEDVWVECDVITNSEKQNKATKLYTELLKVLNG